MGMHIVGSKESNDSLNRKFTKIIPISFIYLFPCISTVILKVIFILHGFWHTPETHEKSLKGILKINELESPFPHWGLNSCPPEY